MSRIKFKHLIIIKQPNNNRLPRKLKKRLKKETYNAIPDILK